MARTLYQILGVPENASVDTIRGAYVQAAGLLRDAGKRSSDELNAVKQAYEILSDPATRARYDRTKYTVADATTGPGEALTGLLTPRVIVWLLVVLGVAVAGAAYKVREQRLARVEQERIEAQKLVEEERRREEAVKVEEERRLSDLKRQEAATERDLARAASQNRSEALRRDSAARSAELRERQLEQQREREAYRREQAERARIERENRLQLEREKRLLRELEANRRPTF